MHLGIYPISKQLDKEIAIFLKSNIIDIVKNEYYTILLNDGGIRMKYWNKNSNKALASRGSIGNYRWDSVMPSRKMIKKIIKVISSGIIKENKRFFLTKKMIYAYNSGDMKLEAEYFNQMLSEGLIE